MVILWVGVARHAQAYPKCARITNFQFFNNGLSYCFDFLQANKVLLELQIDCHILGGRGQARLGIPEMYRNNKFSISQQ